MTLLADSLIDLDMADKEVSRQVIKHSLKRGETPITTVTKADKIELIK